MQVKWTRQALLNLAAAVEHIAKDKPSAAQNTAQQIWDTSQLLAAQPGLGRPGRVPSTRELIIPNLPYILPYTEKAGTIYILRVIHTSMMWPKAL
ncbi:MAG: type II toxin-antitoxin system RelE/ParE family toxin [Desulfobulbaceae bacterium]|nr:type II toxin-antitoxin system RelE/ParE family toxin [Desulfobulbaceae bacterium]